MRNMLRYAWRLVSIDDSRLAILAPIAVLTGFVLKLASQFAAFAFLTPWVSWPHLIAVTIFLGLLLICWRAIRHAQSLESMAEPHMDIQDVFEERRDRGQTIVDLSLLITNRGLSALTNCVVVVERMSMPPWRTDDPFHLPRALFIEAKGRSGRHRKFELRPGQSKKIKLGQYLMSKGDSFARISVYFDDDFSPSFDPDESGEMWIGLYSETAPRYVRLRFERDVDGFVHVDFERMAGLPNEVTSLRSPRPFGEGYYGRRTQSSAEDDRS